MTKTFYQIMWSCWYLVQVSECRLNARGLEFDRLFMVVTDSGVCVSQKRAPQLCTVQPTISSSLQHLILSHPCMCTHTYTIFITHSGTSSSISYSPIPSPITSSSSDSPFCTSITPSLFYSRLKNLPLSQILPPLVSLLPPGLPPRTFAWTVSSELLVFYFYFSLFIVSGPCARLSWPSHQLLSARKSTVSYRIVPPSSPF